MKNWKSDLKKYGVPILIFEGILLYCALVIHFSAVYWDPNWIKTNQYTVSADTQLTADNTITRTGAEFVYAAGAGPETLSIPVDLQGVARMDVNFSVSGAADTQVNVDLYNAEKKYDNDEQEQDFVLTGSERSLSCQLDSGGNHPRDAQLRIVAANAAQNVTVGQITVTTYRRGTLFAPRHVGSLILSAALAVLFGVTFAQYRAIRRFRRKPRSKS